LTAYAEVKQRTIAYESYSEKSILFLWCYDRDILRGLACCYQTDRFPPATSYYSAAKIQCLLERERPRVLKMPVWVPSAISCALRYKSPNRKPDENLTDYAHFASGMMELRIVPFHV
jgi:hypothetical protein